MAVNKKINWIKISIQIVDEKEANGITYYEQEKYDFKYIRLKGVVGLLIWESNSKRAALFAKLRIPDGVEIIDWEDNGTFFNHVPKDLLFERI